MSRLRLQRAKLIVSRARPNLAGAKRALKRRVLKRRAPMGRYTYTPNTQKHILDLARGAYWSAGVLVSARLVPSD